MNHGLALFCSGDLPLPLRLIREIHAKLMKSSNQDAGLPVDFPLVR